jgi:hypothetical protein
MPGRGAALPLDAIDAAGFPVVFGGGRKELKPLKRPLPPVLARFAGGSSLVCDSTDSLPPVVGRLTTILVGLERETNFWKGLLFGLVEAVVDFPAVVPGAL